MQRRHLLLAGASLPLATTAAWSQSTPSATRLVVGFPAGGGVDFVARLLARRLSELTRQSVVVENRGGANGALAADIVAKARPDGLTLLLGSPGETVVGPAAGQKLPYSPTQDLVPIALAGETPLAIAVHPSVPANDLAGLIALMQGGAKLSYGTPGAGSSMHFAGESFNQLAGTAMLHVPYRGAAPAVNDLLGNQVPVAITGMPPMVPHAKAGKLRILAVTTLRRSSTLPNVPAVAEMPGMKDFNFSNWMALFAPAGTPADTVTRIAQLIVQIVREPEVREAMTGAGVEPAGLADRAFADFLAQERRRYGAIAASRGIRYAE
jgi:tripartite-type tricarboxylate transporter receptor subunit TctC